MHNFALVFGNSGRRQSESNLTHFRSTVLENNGDMIAGWCDSGFHPPARKALKTKGGKNEGQAIE
jgi:hypothetical protein